MSVLTVDDVLAATAVRLRTETNIPWYEIFTPDDDLLDEDNPYGVLSVKGPYESTIREWSIQGVEAQPFRGQIRAAVAAQSIDAMRVETNSLVTALRGWSPGAGVSAFTSEMVGSFETSNTKFRPSLYVRFVQFNFTSGL